MLDICNVSKAYDGAGGWVKVLSGVDLRVYPGEFVCVYGASGSGKSTLLNVAAGLEVPDAGDVRVGGRDVSHQSETGRARLRLNHVGVVFQRDNLIRELTAWENVALPLLGVGRPLAESRELVMTALESVGMTSLADRAPDRLSGGERQRIGIARGIVGDRRLLIADEPTGALDSVNSASLFDLLSSLAVSAGLAILVATHDPLALPRATRAMTLRDGKLYGDQ